MKPKVVILVAISILCIGLGVYLGSFLFPFIAHFADWDVFMFPASLTGLFSICSIAYLLNKTRHIFWLPLFVCFALNTWYLYDRYEFRRYNEYGRIKLAKRYDKFGLADEFGRTLISPMYKSVKDLGDYVILETEDGKALYSIEEKGIIIPEGQSLLTYGKIFELNEMFGICTKNNDVIVKPIYEEIKQMAGCFVVKLGGKYGIISNIGQVIEKPKYIDACLSYSDFIFLKKTDHWFVFTTNGIMGVNSEGYDNYNVEYDNNLVVSDKKMKQSQTKWGQTFR